MSIFISESVKIGFDFVSALKLKYCSGITIKQERFSSCSPPPSVCTEVSLVWIHFQDSGMWLGQRMCMNVSVCVWVCVEGHATCPQSGFIFTACGVTDSTFNLASILIPRM